MDRVSDRILDKLSEKVTATIGYRPDLYLADWQPISKVEAKLCLGYQNHLGIPGGEDIRKYVVGIFGGKLLPQSETIRIHKDEGAVTMVASIFTPTQKMEASGTMVAIANTRFIDTKLGEVWEVKSQEDGTKFLSRIVDEDINKIVSERRSRMAVKGAHVSLAGLSAGIPNIEPGAYIKFYFEAKLLEGEVTQVAEQIKVKTTDGKVYSIAKEAVVDLVKLSPKTQDKYQKEMLDYYSQLYGKDFATKMISGS